MNSDALGSLATFLYAIRGKPQGDIIKEFLDTLIFQNSCCESGSVHIYDPRAKKLRLFNEDNFLYERGYLEEGPGWPTELDRFEGIGGRAFRTGRSQYYVHHKGDSDFSTRHGEVPIRSMICVPIIQWGQREPFGIASFHNSEESKKDFDGAIRAAIEVYVSSFGLALEASKQKLILEKSNRIFIVHGRDKASLASLENLLLKKDAEPVVLSHELRTGREILAMLEDVVSTCKAGFVILTPDDEGRLKGEADLQPRARQNVIFESGMLSARFRNLGRVCFLVRRPVELPSDIRGLFCYEFNEIEDIESLISNTLENWGLGSKPSRRPP